MQRAVTKVVIIAVPAKACSGLTLYFVISFFLKSPTVPILCAE